MKMLIAEKNLKRKKKVNKMSIWAVFNPTVKCNLGTICAFLRLYPIFKNIFLTTRPELC